MEDDSNLYVKQNSHLQAFGGCIKYALKKFPHFKTESALLIQ